MQGTAHVDDADLDANRERYERESSRSCPAPRAAPPKSCERCFAWYFARIYVHVRPERVYVWPTATRRRAELSTRTWRRSARGHNEEPEDAARARRGRRPTSWDPRLDALGGREPARGRSPWSAPDGFPFAVRVPVAVDRGRPRRMGADPSRRRGAPGSPPAPACLLVLDAEQRELLVHGDLLDEDGRWVLRPRSADGARARPAPLAGGLGDRDAEAPLGLAATSSSR